MPSLLEKAERKCWRVWTSVCTYCTFDIKYPWRGRRSYSILVIMFAHYFTMSCSRTWPCYTWPCYTCNGKLCERSCLIFLCIDTSNLVNLVGSASCAKPPSLRTPDCRRSTHLVMWMMFFLELVFFCIFLFVGYVRRCNNDPLSTERAKPASFIQNEYTRMISSNDVKWFNPKQLWSQTPPWSVN